MTNCQPGKPYLIQASTNLLGWVSLSTNLATGCTLEFEEAHTSSFNRRFYRAVAP